MGFLFRISGIRKLTLLITNFFFNLKYRNKFGNKVQIFGLPIISYGGNANFSFGKNISLISDIYFSRSGIYHPVIIRLLSEDAELKIGDNTGLNGVSINVMKKVVVGNEVLLGANTLITDTDYHPVDPNNRRYDTTRVLSKPIEIGNNVFIGRNCMILKGVSIGENSIIGAGSVVTKNIPSNEIWAGNPAKFIKKI